MGDKSHVRARPSVSRAALITRDNHVTALYPDRTQDFSGSCHRPRFSFRVTGHPPRSRAMHLYSTVRIPLRSVSEASDTPLVHTVPNLITTVRALPLFSCLKFAICFSIDPSQFSLPVGLALIPSILQCLIFLAYDRRMCSLLEEPQVP